MVATIAHYVELMDCVSPTRVTEIGRVFRGVAYSLTDEVVAMSARDLALREGMRWANTLTPRVRILVGEQALGVGSQWFVRGFDVLRPGDQMWHRGAIRQVREAYLRSAGTLWTITVHDLQGGPPEDVADRVQARLPAIQATRLTPDGFEVDVRGHFARQTLNDFTAALVELRVRAGLGVMPANGAPFPGRSGLG